MISYSYASPPFFKKNDTMWILMAAKFGNRILCDWLRQVHNSKKIKFEDSALNQYDGYN